MRYHYEKPKIYRSRYGLTYERDHPVYHRHALFKMDSRGLSIIQQRYDSDTKTTHWTEIDSWLTDELYLHPKFKNFFSISEPKNQKMGYIQQAPFDRLCGH